jgi:hypothetical protein
MIAIHLKLLFRTKFIIRGSIVSKTAISWANLVKIRPMGVLSKKEMGALRTFSIIKIWMFFEAIIQDPAIHIDRMNITVK